MRIHSFGGLLTFHLERMDWNRISSKAPQPSSGHSATPVGKSIYYFGGRNHSTFTNQIVRFDTGTNN